MSTSPREQHTSVGAWSNTVMKNEVRGGKMDKMRHLNKALSIN